MFRPRIRRTLAVLLAAVVGSFALAVPGSVGADPRWGDLDTARIRPGVQMYTDGAQCTANFVFLDKRNRIYLGYAAHCAGKGSADDINGCTTPSYPRGTPVDFVTGSNLFSGGTQVGRGRLAYSSWQTMQRLGVRDTNRCLYNDFALVRVGKAWRGQVNPTMPAWGGPVGLGRSLAVGDTVYTVGSSSLRGSAAKTANVARVIGKGWAFQIKSGSPLIPGDSGSGFLDPQGRAIGVLSTIEVGLGLGITPVANTIGNLRRELAFARRHSGIEGLRLVAGLAPFQP